MKSKFFLLTATLLVMLNLAKAQTETEPNNSPSSANTATVGQCLKVAFNTNSDEDYFKITLVRGGVLIIHTASIPANNRPIIEIYPPNSSGYIHNGSAAARGSEARTETILAAGTYFIRLRNFYSVPDYSQFDLCFELDTTDPAEPDNSFALATGINLDTCFNARMRGFSAQQKSIDVDYYKFSMPKDGLVSLLASQVPAALRLSARFYSGGLNQIANANAKATGLDLTIDVLLQKGDYYLSINDYNGKLDTNTYSICLNYDTSDVFEFNNTAATAKPIPSDTCFEGKIKGWYWPSTGLVYSDFDAFSFTLKQGGNFTAEITQAPGDLAMEINLHNSNFTQIASNNAVKGSPVSVTKYLCAGKYYVSVSDYNLDETSNSIYKACLSFVMDEKCNKSLSEAYPTEICDTVYSSFASSDSKGYYKISGNGRDINVKVSNIAPNIIAKLTSYDRDFKQIGLPVIASGAGKDVSLTVSNTISGDPYYILAENSNNATSSRIYRFLASDENCKTVATFVDKQNETEVIKIYPNPSSGQFFITGEAKGEIIIYNSLGQIVYQSTVENTPVITLTAGIYYAALKTNDSTAFQKLTVTNY